MLGVAQPQRQQPLIVIPPPSEADTAQFSIEGIIRELLTTNCRVFLFPQEVRSTEQGEGSHREREKNRHTEGSRKGQDPNMKQEIRTNTSGNSLLKLFSLELKFQYVSFTFRTVHRTVFKFGLGWVRFWVLCSVFSSSLFSVF